jgi:hypothetical protein
VNEGCKETLGIKNWKTEAMNRQGWRGLILEAKAEFGLLRHMRRRTSAKNATVVRVILNIANFVCIGLV